MLQRLSLKLQHLYAAGWITDAISFFISLNAIIDTGNLHATARTARRHAPINMMSSRIVLENSGQLL